MKQKIVEIGGEHYFLTEDEWSYLQDTFGFQGIPAYLLFDPSGKLRNKVTGYPGNAEMRKMIEELLP